MTTTALKAKPTATLIIEDVAAQAKDHFEGIVKTGQEQARKHFDQTVAATKQQVEKASAQLLKSYEEYSAFNKATVDALVKSGTVVVKGTEDINKALVAFAQASFDTSVATGRALLSAKSIDEVVDLQNAYAKQSFDALVAETAKLQALSVKVTNEAFAPLNARVNAAVETFAKPLAA
ncbi:phasin family protein [Azospirillum sp. sgz301742]